MRWPAIFVLCLFCLIGQQRLNAQVRPDRFTLPSDSISLESALRQLNADGADLSYRADQLPDKIVALRGGRYVLERWLDMLLRQTNLIYERGAAGYLILPDPALRNVEGTLFGMVTDASSGERLIGATIQIPELRVGSLTNEYGFYSLPTNAGWLKMRVSYLGYVPREVDLFLRSDTLIDLSLIPNRELPQIIVTAGGNQGTPAGYLETGMRIGQAEVAQLGGPGGEDDPIQLARLLPGITSGADGIGGAFIRGSEAGHNLILLDGVPVYSLGHAGGLFSIFNNLAIRRIDIYKEGVPARFGDRIGGILDVHTRDGNLYEQEFTVGTSLLSSRIAAEGPLVDGRSSYLLSGRYFWAGALLSRYSQQYKADRGRSGKADYDVYDINFKLNQRAGERGRVYFSFYRGLDNYVNSGRQVQEVYDTVTDNTPFYYRNPSGRTERIRWGNTIGALRYNYLFNDRMFGNFRLSYSDLSTGSSIERYDSTVETINEIREGKAFSGSYSSEIRQLGAAFDGQYSVDKRRTLHFGTGINLHQFTPLINDGDMELESLRAESQLGTDTIHRPTQWLSYASLSGSSEKLHYRLGLRASVWGNGNGAFTSISPRLLLAGPLNDRLDWQASYDRSVQPVHLLNSFVIGLPSDLWVPSTSGIAPASAQQLAAKLKYRPAKQWLIESSVYYKKMSNLIAYIEGEESNPNWIENLSRGRGRAYGWESMLQRSEGRLRGWLSYTLARSDRTFDRRINLGNTFPFRYDRRHSLKLILIYQLGERTTLTGTWQYESGLAYSLSEVIVPDLDGNTGTDLPFTKERNGYRMPPNHRLDLNLHTVISAAKSKFTHAVDVGLYNAYDRHNAVYFDPRPEYRIADSGSPESTTTVYKVFLAPLLPSLSYQLTFNGGKKSVFGR